MCRRPYKLKTMTSETVFHQLNNCRLEFEQFKRDKRYRQLLEKLQAYAKPLYPRIGSPAVGAAAAVDKKPGG